MHRSNQCNQYIEKKCGNERVINGLRTEEANKWHFFLGSYDNILRAFQDLKEAETYLMSLLGIFLF